MDVAVDVRPAGFYDDPSGLADLRFFDGQVWTGRTCSYASLEDSLTQTSASAGWYPDPAGSSDLRFFDGRSWSSQLRSPESFTSPSQAPTMVVEPSPWESVRQVQAVSLAPSTALRLSRRSLADLERSERVLTESLAERSSKRFSSFLLFGGLVVVLYALWVTVGTNLLAQHNQDVLLAQYEQSTAAPVEPTVEPTDPAPTDTPSEDPGGFTFNREPMPTLPAEGQAVGIIEIPAIGLKQVFVSGTGVPDLKLGPGVWKYGSFPGTPGNATISGHRTTYGGPFRHIDSLKTGDQIIIHVEGQPDAVFEVRGSTVVPPSRVQVTEATPGVRLTLTTCDPVGSDAARLVVQAELVSGAWVDKALPADQWQIVK